MFSAKSIRSQNIIGFFKKKTSRFFLKKWANPGLFLSIFILFSLQFQHKLKKVQMVCLGFEPGAAGWQAQTKPRSYGGTPKISLFKSIIFCRKQIRGVFEIGGFVNPIFGSRLVYYLKSQSNDLFTFRNSSSSRSNHYISKNCVNGASWIQTVSPQTERHRRVHCPMDTCSCLVQQMAIGHFFAHFRSFKTTIQFVLHLHAKIIHLVYTAEI